ncbi:hypothetical protein ACSDR0_38410 [Streptosporangium sp. G11]
MRALLRRFRSGTSSGGVTFDEIRGEVCDTGCRASARVERASTNVLFNR